MPDEMVVFVATGNKDEAKMIAKDLVESRLAACVSIVPAMQSIFRWEGKICEESESLLIIKSVKSNMDSLIDRIKQLHSYDVPEVIALPIVAGSKEYLNWLHAETVSAAS